MGLVGRIAVPSVAVAAAVVIILSMAGAELRWIALAVALLFVAVAGVARAVGAIAVPLHALSEAAGRISCDDAEVDVSAFSARGDEVGDLARSLAALAERVGEQHAEASQRIASLAATERSLRAMVDAAPSGLIVADAHGAIELVNAEIERMVGHRRGDLIGRPIGTFLPVNFNGERGGPQQAMLAGPHHASGVAAIRGDGARSPVDIMHRRVMLSGEGKVLVAVVDASERRQAERRLAVRARDLERSNTDLARLATVAAHDLQEPLRTIATYLDLLKVRCRDKVDTETVECIDNAADCAARLKYLIDDLLKYARVGSDAMVIESVDTDAVVAAAVDVLAGPIAENDADIVFGPLPWVRGDVTQLERLFVRLIENAIKYRTAARPELRIFAEPDGAFWRFAVRDNGIGVDPRYGTAIFELFKRLHEESAYPGTGIGLAVAKTIVERHGGRIWLEPTEGGGSTFRFTLPAAFGAEDEGDEQGVKDDEERGVDVSSSRE